MLDSSRKKVLSELLNKEGYNPENAKISPYHEGGNNRVVKIEIENDTLLAKFYFADGRDRLGAEWDFLNYAMSKGIQCVPKPIAYHSDEKVLISQFIEGKKLSKEEITRFDIDRTISFFIHLNEDKTSSGIKLPLGAEACFSIENHLLTIENRLRRLKESRMEGVFQGDFDEVFNTLVETWKQLEIKIKTLSHKEGIDFKAPLHKELQCISPSDFGFHNSLRLKNGELCFVDFEYAGWDDPAKMVSDFFLQPEIPAGFQYFEYFMERIFSIFPNSQKLVIRTRLLYPLFTIKWCCIMLNCFVPEFLQRTLFSNPHQNVHHLQEERLKRAILYLSYVDRYN